MYLWCVSIPGVLSVDVSVCTAFLRRRQILAENDCGGIMLCIWEGETSVVQSDSYRERI